MKKAKKTSKKSTEGKIEKSKGGKRIKHQKSIKQNNAKQKANKQKNG